MPVDNMPHITAESADRTLTLGEMRELVEAAALYPPSTIVRGQMIPFFLPDLGNTKGGRIMKLALDKPEEARRG